MHFSVNKLKRCLITLHLSLNDFLRRSVDLMRSAYTNHYQTRTIRRNTNSNTIVLSGSCVFIATVLSKAAETFVLVLTVSLVSCSTSSVKKLLCKMMKERTILIESCDNDNNIFFYSLMISNVLYSMFVYDLYSF